MAENDNDKRVDVDHRIVRDWYTTAQAAEYLATTVAALHMHVQRGNLKPDSRGGRGRFKGHRFSRATLDAFNRGDRAA